MIEVIIEITEEIRAIIEIKKEENQIQEKINMTGEKEGILEKQKLLTEKKGTEAINPEKKKEESQDRGQDLRIERTGIRREGILILNQLLDDK